MATVRGSTGVGRQAVQALGNKITASVTSQMRGFGRNVMGAAMGQMPGIQAASGYFSQARDSLGSFASGSSGTSTQMNSAAAMVKEQKQANIINLQQVRELRALRNDAAAQSRAEILSTKEVSAAVEQVNKTMKEVKESIEEIGVGGSGFGGGGGGRGRRAARLARVAAGKAAPVAAVLGGFLAYLGLNSITNEIRKANPVNQRSQRIYSKRVGNITRDLTDAKTSTLSSMYGASGGGGATLKQRMGAVAVADTEQLKETRKGNIETKKGLRELAVGIDKVGRNTGYKGIREIEERRARDTRAVKSRTEKAEDRAVRQLYDLNRKVFTDVLRKNIGYDYTKMVTQAQASKEGYLGGTISEMTGFRKGMERTFEKLLGKEYGAQYGRIFTQLGEVYIEEGAKAVGTSLFGGVIGNEKARVLSGQIVGNLAKGNKQVAAEQLLYGFTGQATGVETVMAKYGFATTDQGIQYTGNVLAAGTNAAIVNTTGRGEYVTVRNPATGETSVVRNFGGIIDLPAGPAPQPVVTTTSSSISQMPYTPMYTASYAPGNYIDLPYDDKGTRANVSTTLGTDDRKIFREQLDANYSLIDTTTDGLKATTAAGLAGATSTSEGFKANINASSSIAATQMDLSQRQHQQTIEALYATRGGGGGTSVSVGAPSSFGTFGNFLMDMGTAIVANKLTSGIKNPYMRAAANYGISVAGNSALRTFMGGGGDYLGNINAALFGKGGISGFTGGISSGFTNLFSGGSTAAVPSATAISTGGSYVANVPGMGLQTISTDLLPASMATPIGTATFMGGAGAAQGLTNVGGQLYTGADAGFAVSASTANSSAAAAAGSGTMAAISGTLAAISAFNQFKSGDPVGGIGSTMMAVGATMGPAGVPLIIIGAGLNILSSVFGIGKSKPPPPPNHGVHRAMMIEGNNNLAAKETIHFYNDGNKTAGPDPGVIAICDEYLNIAFNTIKTFEMRGIKTNPPIMWLQHAARQRQDGKDGNMWLAVYTTEFDSSNPTDTSKAALVIHFGQPRYASGADASKIVEELAKFYEKNSGTSKTKLDEALRNIRSSAYFEIAFNKAKGLEDLSAIEKGLFAEGVDESRIIADYKLKAAGIKEVSGGKYPGLNIFSSIQKSSEMFKGELVGTGRYETTDDGSMGPEIMTPSGKVYAWNPLTNKYDILVQDPTTGLQISSTGQLVQATEVKEGLAGAIALLTDAELVSIAGPYAGQGAAWLRRYYGSWLESSYGEKTGIKLLNDMIKAKGYESNLRIISQSYDDEGGGGYTYGSTGRIYKYASGVTTATEGSVVAFDPIKNQAIFDVNGNQKFDISDVERYYEMNPIPTGTELGNLAPAVSIAPSSSDNSTTINNYGMGTSNANDPYRSQRTNTRPSLISLAG